MPVIPHTQEAELGQHGKLLAQRSGVWDQGDESLGKSASCASLELNIRTHGGQGELVTQIVFQSAHLCMPSHHAHIHTHHHRHHCCRCRHHHHQGQMLGLWLSGKVLSQILMCCEALGSNSRTTHTHACTPTCMHACIRAYRHTPTN